MIRKLIRDLSIRSQIRRDPVDWSRHIGVRIGSECRLIGINSGTFGSEPYLVTLGDHVTVTEGVRFVTHDGGVWVLRPEYPNIDVFGPIRVGNNVFIGTASILLPGVTIGDDVVVGAGSVVNRNVPSGSVAVGVPARVVSSMEEYRGKSLAKALMTKSLTAASKRELLEQMYRQDPY